MGRIESLDELVGETRNVRFAEDVIVASEDFLVLHFSPDITLPSLGDIGIYKIKIASDGGDSDVLLLRHLQDQSISFRVR